MPILSGFERDLFWLLESLRWIDCVAKCSKNAACTKYELTKFKRNFSSKRLHHYQKIEFISFLQGKLTAIKVEKIYQNYTKTNLLILSQKDLNFKSYCAIVCENII